MAIQYINARFISRSSGHNALAAAAYRANEKLFSEGTSETFDYTNKTDCVYKEILLPQDAFTEDNSKDNHPFLSRERIWNAVEESENHHKRKASAQLSMELKIALPKELLLEQQIELVNGFIKENYIDKFGVAADICIHDKGDGNPHAHVMITLRKLLGVTFSPKKERTIAPKIMSSKHGVFCVPDQLNQQWNDYQNRKFEENNIDLKVDEIRIIPTVHEGKVRDSDNYYGKVEENKTIKQENLDIVLSEPEKIIEILEEKYAVFDKRDIEKMVFTQTESSANPNDYHDVLNQILASDKLVQLGYSEAGRLSYTTLLNSNKEIAMMDMANNMRARNSHNIHSNIIDNISKKDGLSDEQSLAIKHITQSGKITCVVGSAGAGKTMLMKSLNEIYKNQNINVFGGAVAGKAAQGLEDGAGIKSKTIASILNTYKDEPKHRFLPPKGSVFVVDEAGMIGLKDMNLLVEMSQNRNYTLVLVGDPDQLQPVAKGAPFRAILERIGFASLKEIWRQSDDAERKITQKMAQGEIGVAIDHYLADDRVLLDDPDKLKVELFKQWESYSDDLNETIILAHTQKDVESLNTHARTYLLDHGKIEDSQPFNVSVSGETHAKEFGVNERIIFLKNDRTLDVKNGQLGQIIKLKDSQIAVKLDNGNIINFNANDYKNFDHGYAVTVHKAQGVTVDNCLAYASGKGWDRFLTYVSLSRHRHNAHLYADKDSYKDIQGLKRQLGSAPLRDNVLDYPLQFAIRRGADATKFANNAVDKIKGTYHKTRNSWNFLFNYSQYITDKENVTRQDNLQAKQAINREAIQVADLADVHRDALTKYHEFKEEYGVKWYENKVAMEAYKDIEQVFYDRNKAAHVLYNKSVDFSRALSLNNITVEKLEEWSAAYIAENRVRVFAKAQGHAVKGKLAQEITDHPESNRYVSSRNLWKEVNETQSSYVERVRSGQFEGFSARLNTLDKYLAENRAATSYWKKSQGKKLTEEEKAKAIDPSVEEKAVKKDKNSVLPKHLQKYDDISKVFNARSETLAAKIMADFENYQPVLAVKFPYQATYDKVIKNLKRKADNFAKRETIRTYISPESTQLEREKAAYKLNQDFKGHVGMGYEEGLIWGNVARTAAPEKARQDRASIDPQYLPLFDAVQAYQVKIHAAAQAYSALKTAETSLKQQLNIPPENRLSRTQLTAEIQTLQKASYALMATRNETAAEVNNQHPELMQWYENDAKKLDQVLPQFKADRFKRHVQLHDYAKMVKATTHERFQDYSRTQKTFWDYNLITQRLMENPTETYTQILGQPKSRNSREMRWSGGLIVSLTGKNQGQWYDFAQGMGGSPVQAMMAFNGTTYLDALKKGASMANLSESYAMVENNESATSIRTIAPNEDKEQAYKIESAQSIWNSTVPVENTLAEEYMAVHRNIYDVSRTELRFLPVGAKWINYVEDENNKGMYIKEEKINKVPAMVISSTDENNNVVGVQRTYLDPKTANKNAYFDNPKLSKGSIKNGAVLQAGNNGIVYIAEGIETGASIALADKNATVLISMSVGNMQNMVDKIKAYNPKEVIILKDNDGLNAKSDTGFNKAVEAYKQAGFDVRIKEPEMLERIVKAKGKDAKTDWNDVIQENGLYILCEDLGLPEPKANRKYLLRLYNAKNPNVRIANESPEAKRVIDYVMLENKSTRGVYKSEHSTILSATEKDALFNYSILNVRKSAYELVIDVKTNKYLDKFTQLKKRMYSDARKYVNEHLKGDSHYAHAIKLSRSKISDHGRHIAALDKSINEKSDVKSKSKKHTDGYSY